MFDPDATDAAIAKGVGARSRKHELWYDDAAAALGRALAGAATDTDWAALVPFSYGRWDAEAAAYNGHMEEARNPEAAAAFADKGAFDPPATRAALAKLNVPVLVVAGRVDVGNPVSAMAQVADLFPRGELDGPTLFRTLVAARLSEPAQ